MKKMFQAGFSLIEVLIGMGLMGMTMTALMNITDQSNKNLSQTSERFDESELLNEIRAILSDPESCQLSLANKNALNTSEGMILDLKEKMGNQIVTRFKADLTKHSPGYGLKNKIILGYSLKSSVLPMSPPADAIGFDPSSTSGSATFKIRFDRNKRQPFTASFRIRVKSVSLSDRSIVECSYAGAETSGAEDFCALMRGMIWNAGKCERKPDTCSAWHGNGDLGKWTGDHESSCPTNCYVKDILLGQEHHSSGDFDSSAVRMRCCCPDLT